MPSAAIYDISKSDNPLKTALEKLGDLSKIKQLIAGRILVWTYIHPQKTKGGIILTDREVGEDLWQGTVGYVLKKGPLAFVDDETHKFHGQTVEIGDWVTYRAGDAKRVQINGVDCRIIEDSLIDMVIDHPELVTHRK